MLKDGGVFLVEETGESAYVVCGEISVRVCGVSLHPGSVDPQPDVAHIVLVSGVLAEL